MSKKIDVDISEKSGTIRCRVRVPRYNQDYRVKTRLRTSDIRALLGERGYTLKDYELQEDHAINNKADPPALEATWVFVKKKAPPRKKRVTKPKPTTKE